MPLRFKGVNRKRWRYLGAFSDEASPRTAMLVECGQHWAHGSVEVAILTCRQFLAALGTVEPAVLDRLAPSPVALPPRIIEVSHAVTVEHGPFRFEAPYQGLEVVPAAGTVIAYDGAVPVRTPYDHCVLVMPSRRLGPGLTAVRLGRFAP